MAPLRILISNDDGVFADGIKALALAAAGRGHQAVSYTHLTLPTMRTV